jgi:hypothetical protein
MTYRDDSLQGLETWVTELLVRSRSVPRSREQPPVSIAAATQRSNWRERRSDARLFCPTPSQSTEAENQVRQQSRRDNQRPAD